MLNIDDVGKYREETAFLWVHHNVLYAKPANPHFDNVLHYKRAILWYKFIWFDIFYFNFYLVWNLICLYFWNNRKLSYVVKYLSLVNKYTYRILIIHKYL